MPDSDILEVTAPVYDVYWVADFNRRNSDIIEPLYSLPHLSIYII